MMEDEIGVFQKLLQQNSLRSLFGGGSRRSTGEEEAVSCIPIPQLSQIANSVVSRCARIIRLSTEEVQHQFETQLPDHVREHSLYARNLLEYFSFNALRVVTKNPRYLANKEFRRLTFDMMLAWETPSAECESILNENDIHGNKEIEDDDEGSLFYTNPTCMAVQVDRKKCVGPEAFARIAPACPTIADVLNVYNLFDALTISSAHQLHFLVYDKYLGSLDKVLKSAKNISRAPPASVLKLSKGEIILDIDGTMPTQPVFQHIGISAWPGRLTLTSHAVYFEPLGVVSYDKPVIYDLATDLKQVIKPDLTGPLGVRLFDKAVMYKSNSLKDPVYFEFPEFKGHARRDYWLAIIREIMYAHRFIRNFNVNEMQQAEALSKAILGIFQYRAVKDAFHTTPSHFKTLLAFNLSEKLPKGDEITGALYNHLKLLHTRSQQDFHETASKPKMRVGSLPLSLLTLTKMGFMLLEEVDWIEDRRFLLSDFCVGETSPLEMAVKQSLYHSGPANAAQATVQRMKIEGIYTNLALMKELLAPVIKLYKLLCFLAAWEDPFKSAACLALVIYMNHRGWIGFILPFFFVSLAIQMLWRKHYKSGKPLEAFRVTVPPDPNAVEQILNLQDAISQSEALIQAGNIILLKLRSILFAALPQATDTIAMSLVATAAAFAVLPFRQIMVLLFLEAYTRKMPLRKRNTEKMIRRLREWWIRVPAAPVQLVRTKENKKRK